MKKSELRKLIKEELQKLNEKTSSTTYAFYANLYDNVLKYQIPYILPGEVEKLSFTPLDLWDPNKDKAKFKKLGTITQKCNDKIISIIEKAERDIKKLGVECKNAIEKDKDL